MNKEMVKDINERVAGWIGDDPNTLDIILEACREATHGHATYAKALFDDSKGYVAWEAISIYLGKMIEVIRVRKPY